MSWASKAAVGGSAAAAASPAPPVTNVTRLSPAAPLILRGSFVKTCCPHTGVIRHGFVIACDDANDSITVVRIVEHGDGHPYTDADHIIFAEPSSVKQPTDGNLKWVSSVALSAPDQHGTTTPVSCLRINVWAIDSFDGILHSSAVTPIGDTRLSADSRKLLDERLRRDVFNPLNLRVPSGLEGAFFMMPLAHIKETKQVSGSVSLVTRPHCLLATDSRGRFFLLISSRSQVRQGTSRGTAPPVHWPYRHVPFCAPVNEARSILKSQGEGAAHAPLLLHPPRLASRLEEARNKHDPSFFRLANVQSISSIELQKMMVTKISGLTLSNAGAIDLMRIIQQELAPTNVFLLRRRASSVPVQAPAATLSVSSQPFSKGPDAGGNGGAGGLGPKSSGSPSIESNFQAAGRGKDVAASSSGPSGGSNSAGMNDAAVAVADDDGEEFDWDAYYTEEEECNRLQQENDKKNDEPRSVLAALSAEMTSTQLSVSGPSILERSWVLAREATEQEIDDGFSFEPEPQQPDYSWLEKPSAFSCSVQPSEQIVAAILRLVIAGVVGVAANTAFYAQHYLAVNAILVQHQLLCPTLAGRCLPMRHGSVKLLALHHEKSSLTLPQLPVYVDGYEVTINLEDAHPDIKPIEEVDQSTGQQEEFVQVISHAASSPDAPDHSSVFGFSYAELHSQQQGSFSEAEWQQISRHLEVTSQRCFGFEKDGTQCVYRRNDPASAIVWCRRHADQPQVAEFHGLDQDKVNASGTPVWWRDYFMSRRDNTSLVVHFAVASTGLSTTNDQILQVSAQPHLNQAGVAALAAAAAVKPFDLLVMPSLERFAATTKQRTSLTLSVGAERFTSAEALRTRTSSILCAARIRLSERDAHGSLPRLVPLQSDEDELLRAVFQQHPKFAQKTAQGTVEQIVVALTEEFPDTACFHARLSNGKLVDFSIPKAINSIAEASKSSGDGHTVGITMTELFALVDSNVKYSGVTSSMLRDAAAQNFPAVARRFFSYLDDLRSKCNAQTVTLAGYNAARFHAPIFCSECAFHRISIPSWILFADVFQGVLKVDRRYAGPLLSLASSVVSSEEILQAGSPTLSFTKVRLLALVVERFHQDALIKFLKVTAQRLTSINSRCI